MRKSERSKHRRGSGGPTVEELLAREEALVDAEEIVARESHREFLRRAPRGWLDLRFAAITRRWDA